MTWAENGTKSSVIHSPCAVAIPCPMMSPSQFTTIIGKLPSKTVRESYSLEYGTDSLEVHEDAMLPGEKVLLVDDLLATGGTAEAGIKLIERLGAEIVGCAFVVDLPDLGGRKKLEGMGMQVHALCAFEGL